MLFTLCKSKHSLLLTLVLLAFSACKQSEFYDKAALLDSGKAAGSNPGVDIGTAPSGGTETGVVVTDPGLDPATTPVATGEGNTGGTTVTNGGTNGGTNSGTTSPLPPIIVSNPPSSTDPVSPVILPPVLTDPTAGIVPPISETPVVNPPAIETPVVNPPIVNNPVETPIIVVSTNPKVDCVGAWSVCSNSCGDGVMTYQISQPASGGGLQCSSTQGATQVCHLKACTNLVDRSETFIQDSTRDGDVDILWVIDDSGSMADNQENLARNFNSFIDQFLKKNVDFKMAITTTDGTSTRNGKMVGDSSKLTHASAIGNRAAFTNNFSKWVKVGTSGSGIEQGLKCASAFMDRYSSSFLRQDAYLAVVFLSDEEDQSEKKVSEYLAKLKLLKKNAGMVKAYSIVTTKLPANAQWESIGKRYIEVSNSTGGIFGEITGDFASLLQNMGGSIVNLIDRFALADAPYQNKIQVFVNSVEKTNGWSFDMATHSLKFNADSIPAEGSKIEVRYKVQATVLGAI